MNQQYDIIPGMSVCVVGFGCAGQSLFRYLSARGARMMVSDSRAMSELSGQEKDLLESSRAEYEGGGNTADFIGRADLIVLSPGVSPDHPVLRRMADAGKAVIGELALAAGNIEVPVIAVSGTNGKTTVTELIGKLLEAAGKKVFVGGNIGTPIAEYLRNPDGYDVVVIEVSSFQLELSGQFAADIALLLNITPDHLDRHGTIERYARVKMNLFRNREKTSHAIINGEDPVIGRHLHFSGIDSFELFGYDADCCAVISGNTVTIAGGNGENYDLSGSDLATVTGCLNSAAALLAVRPFGVERTTALRTLVSFKTGRHRMQNIALIEGLTYINDSKATNTGAVNKALEQVGGSVVLIAGVKEKGDDFSLLRKNVQRYAKALVLIGESAGKLAAVLNDLVPIRYAGSMTEAVSIATSLADPGDSILLSPACASFDMFDNYCHRGEMFEQAVNDIQKNADVGAV